MTRSDSAMSQTSQHSVGTRHGLGGDPVVHKAGFDLTQLTVSIPRMISDLPSRRTRLLTGLHTGKEGICGSVSNSTINRGLKAMTCWCLCFHFFKILLNELINASDTKPNQRNLSSVTLQVRDPTVLTEPRPSVDLLFTRMLNINFGCYSLHSKKFPKQTQLLISSQAQGILGGHEGGWRLSGTEGCLLCGSL